MRKDKLKTEIERTKRNADKVLEASRDKFKVCPNCGLPTHYMDERRRAFCATCNEYYDICPEGTGRTKLAKAEMRNSVKIKIATGIVAALLILSFVGYGLYLLFSDEEPNYISIHDISDIRELPVTEDVPVRTMSQGELEEYLGDSIDEEIREELIHDEIFYKCMFVIDEDWDLVEIATNQSTGTGIAGFYDTETKEMYVIGNIHSERYVNYILSHEFTHALQDQNFGLTDYMDNGAYDTDISRLCAIEGDAMLTMENWADDNLDNMDEILIGIESAAQLLSSWDPSNIAEGNRILSDMTYFPYQEGLDFVKNVYAEKGWEGVNDLFTIRPPLSSEQIIHFDKYLEYERPHDVSFDGNIGDMTLIFTSSVGEKLLSEILDYKDINGGILGTNILESPSDMATGWGGDRFHYYENDESFLSVLVTSWDTEGDNQHFDHAYGELMDSMGDDFRGDGIYRVRGNYLYKSTGDTRTTIHYSDSLDVIEGFS